MITSLKFKLLVFLLILPAMAFSQRWKRERAEVTAGFGASNYFGDIGGTVDENNWLGLKDIDIVSTRPNVNFGARYRLKEDMNIRANLAFGYLEGTDIDSRNEGRNFAFSSSVYEFTAVYEYSLIPESSPVNYSLGSLFDGLRSNNASLNTYVFGGLGVSFFDVKALRDMEGSERFNDNNSMTLVVPLGVGIKYPIASGIHLSLEVGGRWTSTDYLDGYTSQYSTANDVYYFSMLNVVIKIDTRSYRRFGR
jgi:hypothetical protein